MAKLAMLGTGLIGMFYTMSLTAKRGRDQITTVYAQRPEATQAFAERWGIPHWTTNLAEAIQHPDVDIVVIGLPNHLHKEAAVLAARAGKAVLCTKPLARDAAEAKDMLDAVEGAGVFHGYLEDLVYTPKTLKSLRAVQNGSIGKVLWTRSREAHAGPHSDWFWKKEFSGGGAIVDMGCHCIEIGRNFIGKDVKPLEVVCWADTQVHPIDEVSGTQGTIWLNHWLRTGFETFSAPGQRGYVSEKTETDSGWLFPVGDEVVSLGYEDMFMDMLNAYEQSRPPMETFYDGYVVNAIIDAAYRSVASKQWEPVQLDVWRGSEEEVEKSELAEFDAEYFLIKREIMPDGQTKLILKDRQTDEIIQRIQ
jgi:predicted dehydrogenase